MSDPYYSYGYRDDRLVGIYDHDGRRIDARRAQLQLGAAKSYYARAERLHRAAERDRFGVSAPRWASQREAIARDREAVAGRAGDAEAAIFDAHVALLDDEALLEPAREAIAGGATAERGWHDAAEQVAATRMLEREGVWQKPQAEI